LSKSIEYSFTMHFADLQLPSTVPELRTSLPDMEMEDLHQQQHRQPLIDTGTRAGTGGGCTTAEVHSAAPKGKHTSPLVILSSDGGFVKCGRCVGDGMTALQAQAKQINATVVGGLQEGFGVRLWWGLAPNALRGKANRN
jgi:hypothetical protein